MNVREAIERGDVSALQSTLRDDPASRDAVIHWGPKNKNACHPLHYVCDKVFDGTLSPEQSTALARVLIAAGADVTFQNGDPLIAAASLGAVEVAFELLEAGARHDLLAPGGETPLHWAAFVGSDRLVQRLIQLGAPLEVRDREWDTTPLGWALHGWKSAPVPADGAGHRQTVMHLISAGAAVDPMWLEWREVRSDPEVLAALRGGRL